MLAYLRSKLYFFKTNDNRLFLHIGKYCFAFELYLFSKECRRACISFTLRHDYESTIGFDVGIPFIFMFYFHIDMGYYKVIEKFCGKYKSRSYRINFDDIGGRFMFHRDDDDYDCSNCSLLSSISYLSFDWESLFKGKQQVDSKIIFEEKVKLTIPQTKEYKEKTYDVIVNKKEYHTGYSRWFTKKWYRWCVDCPEGVKHPGKGTESYNCGEDATYSISFSCDEINNKEDALQRFSDACNETRERYPL